MEKLLYDHIVVRYGELSTKGKNRKEFTKKLTENIRKRLLDHPSLTYKTLHDGLFIELHGEDYEVIREELKDVFGFSYFSGSIRTSTDIEEITKTALYLAQNREAKTFKIAARRSDKTYPMHSDEINRHVASAILKNTDLKVDVHDPDLMIYIVINRNEAFISDEKVRGMGGYPTGVNGRALLMLSGGIDSPVAGWYTMKRGLKIEAIHFASEPYTSAQAKEKVITLARKLSVYQNDVIIHMIPFTDLQLAIYKNCDHAYAITIMRRMMYRIADTIARNRKLIAITNGESLGQVASQTPESLSVIGEVSKTLILRPLCMLDKLEIIDVAKKIDTYETSILPFQDCCTIFDPTNSVIKPKEDKCLEQERRFNYQELVDRCVENDEMVRVSYRDEEVKENESIF
ncbi:MAG: tRNA 4-thiouridine(8) synthase ThiI [Erysipelotrichaceae bacterium]|nr:tRNA 4-thiouridine(8) synthase ThiI [Erysipelotrichaceae bacterium]